MRVREEERRRGLLPMVGVEGEGRRGARGGAEGGAEGGAGEGGTKRLKSDSEADRDISGVEVK